MEPLGKNFQEHGNHNDTRILPVILKYGSIGIVILVLIMLFLRFGLNIDYTKKSGATLIVQMATPFINFVIYLVLMIFAITSYKKSNNGFVSLGKAFGVTYLTGLFMASITMILSILLVYLVGWSGSGIGSTSDTLSGIPESKSKTILMSSVFVLFVFGCVAGALLALIVSLIAKKKKPIAFNVS